MFEPEVSIADRKIGPLHPPYIICELSANHNGSLERAIKMIEVAAETGAGFQPRSVHVSACPLVRSRAARRPSTLGKLRLSAIAIIGDAGLQRPRSNSAMISLSTS